MEFMYLEPPTIRQECASRTEWELACLTGFIMEAQVQAADASGGRPAPALADAYFKLMLSMVTPAGTDAHAVYLAGHYCVHFCKRLSEKIGITVPHDHIEADDSGQHMRIGMPAWVLASADDWHDREPQEAANLPLETIAAMKSEDLFREAVWRAMRKKDFLHAAKRHAGIDRKPPLFSMSTIA